MNFLGTIQIFETRDYSNVYNNNIVLKNDANKITTI